MPRMKNNNNLPPQNKQQQKIVSLQFEKMR